MGLPLVLDEQLARRIEDRFRRHALPMPPRNLRQAMVPRGAAILPNRLGTAPGLWLQDGRVTLVLLPGVPAEMRQMVDDSVLPRFPVEGDRFAYCVIKIAGLTESEVDRRLDAVARSADPVAWTILAAPEQIEIHLRERVRAGEPPSEIERIDRAIVAALGAHVFARDEETMEEVIGRLLVERSESLATAESITGGGIARRITSVPGASRYFRGAAVVYTDESKKALLGVGAGTLETHGAVSPETAVEMARGARRVFGSTWAIAATGYAGPQGGGPERPAGTVVLGLAGPEIETSRALRLPGEREMVRARTGRTALELLRGALLGVEM